MVVFLVMARLPSKPNAASQWQIRLFSLWPAAPQLGTLSPRSALSANFTGISYGSRDTSGNDLRLRLLCSRLVADQILKRLSRNRPKTAPAPTQALTGMSSVVLDPVATCPPFVRKSVVRLACGFMIWQSLNWSAASGLRRGNNRAHQALAWDASAFV